MYFLNSLSDQFHPRVPLAYTQETFRVIQQASWHTVQILTKRSKLLRKYSPLLEWPPNLWMGVSVGQNLHRYPKRD